MLLGRVRNHKIETPPAEVVLKTQKLSNKHLEEWGGPDTPTAGTWSFMQLCLSLLSAPCFILENAVSFKSKWLHTKLNVQSVRFSKRFCVYQNKCHIPLQGKLKRTGMGEE